MRAGRRSLVGAAGALALSAGFLGAAPPAQAAEPDRCRSSTRSTAAAATPGTYTGEFVEVQIPAGTSSAGLSIELYNGGSTPAGACTTPTRCRVVTAPVGQPAVAVLDYPSNGIQNGDPDGLALVGTVRGASSSSPTTAIFAATAGTANGTLSNDFGVREAAPRRPA